MRAISLFFFLNLLLSSTLFAEGVQLDARFYNKSSSKELSKLIALELDKKLVLPFDNAKELALEFILSRGPLEETFLFKGDFIRVVRGAKTLLTSYEVVFKKKGEAIYTVSNLQGKTLEIKWNYQEN